jgi:hypothetical protein
MLNTLVDNKSEFEALARTLISKCETEIRAEYSDFAMYQTKLDWSPSRASSRGGWYGGGPGVSIAMYRYYIQQFSPFRVYEYASFDTDPVIGGFYATSNAQYLAMVVCHEMAHAVQFYRMFVLKEERSKPHGLVFKKHYAKLRKKILNPHLPNQKTTKELYNNLIKAPNGL